jgi:hypothetical protein
MRTRHMTPLSKSSFVKGVQQQGVETRMAHMCAQEASTLRSSGHQFLRPSKGELVLVGGARFKSAKLPLADQGWHVLLHPFSSACGQLFTCVLFSVVSSCWFSRILFYLILFRQWKERISVSLFLPHTLQQNKPDVFFITPTLHTPTSTGAGPVSNGSTLIVRIS